MGQRGGAGMILQALKEYYDRKSADPDGGIAPEGFEYKEIPFVIVLNNEGEVIQIDDTRKQVGRNLRAKAFLVPQGEKRASGVRANLLWDNAEYALGLCRSEGKPDRVVEQHNAFIHRIRSLNSNDEGVLAILNFVQNKPVDKIIDKPLFDEISASNPFISFRLVSDSCLICEREAVVVKILEIPSEGNVGICMITGVEDSIANLQPAIKGVQGANTTGGNIVSFNLSAFNSFGKSQGKNAPIGEKTTFAYTTALNYLLGKDSSQKLRVGDATAVFWSERKSHFEHEFSLFLDEPPKDNPDALTNAVNTLLKAIDTGVMTLEEKNTRFFILGLSPNAARISIRFWHVGTIGEFSGRLAQHFHDLEIVHASHERDHLSMWWLLSRISAQEKTENIPPNLAGEWMRAILAGLPYPDSLFQAALRRIQAERKVTYPRVAIVKACLNRKKRFSHLSEKEITVSLDKENNNVGYRLGRLFAVLEKIQEDAQPNINATIRDRYYSAASGTPASVMPILLRMKNHHLAKLPHKGQQVNYEKLLGEVLSEIGDFPPQLMLQDQGRFAIGYYHQRQDFFTKQQILTTEQGE
jgi:CRISPR-associated protein Csd1